MYYFYQFSLPSCLFAIISILHSNSFNSLIFTIPINTGNNSKSGLDCTSNNNSRHGRGLIQNIYSVAQLVLLLNYDNNRQYNGKFSIKKSWTLQNFPSTKKSLRPFRNNFKLFSSLKVGGGECIKQASTKRGLIQVKRGSRTWQVEGFLFLKL